MKHAESDIRVYVTNDYKILFEKLCDKVKLMRAWQKQKDQRASYGIMLAGKDHRRMRTLEREVDNILLLDQEGMVVFSKSKVKT